MGGRGGRFRVQRSRGVKVRMWEKTLRLYKRMMDFGRGGGRGGGRGLNVNRGEMRQEGEGRGLNVK